MLKPVTAKEIPEVQALFTEVWNMVKQYYNITIHNSDEEWDSIVSLSGEMYNRYKNEGKALDEFAKKLILDALDFLEKTAREREGQ